MMIRILIVCLVLLCTPQELSALTKEYHADASTRLQIPLSNEGVNRVAVHKDRIVKVIGQEEDYHIDGDASQGHVFMTPKLNVNDMIPVTIITESGFIQDINFKVKSGIEPLSIVIKPVVKQSKRNIAPYQKVLLESEIIEAIKNVHRGNVRDFSFRRLEDVELQNISLKISKAYEYSNRRVIVTKYECFDVPKGDISQYFPNTLAVWSAGNTIYTVERI